MSDVRVKISSENSSLNAGLASASKAVDQFRDHAEESFREAGKELLGAFAVASVVEGIHSLMEEFSQVADMATRLDTTAESVQKIAYAAKLSGTNLEAVTKGLEKVGINAQDALAGNQNLADAFEKLGINMEAFIDLSPEEKLIALSKATEEAEHSSAELGKAYKDVLGKAAGELLPLLKKGPDEIKAIFDSASVASNETVAKMKEDEDKLESFWMSFKTVAVSALSGVIDFVTTLWEGLNSIGVYLANLPDGFKAANEAAADFVRTNREKREKETEERNKPKVKTDLDALLAKSDAKDEKKRQQADELGKLQEANAKKEEEAYLRSLTLLEKKAELQRELTNAQIAAGNGTYSELEREQAKGRALDIQKELDAVNKEQAREEERAMVEQGKKMTKLAKEQIKDKLEAEKKELKSAEQWKDSLEKTKNKGFTVDSLRQIGGGLAGANYKLSTAKDSLQKQQLDYARQTVEKLTAVVTALEASQKQVQEYDGSFQ